MYHRRDAEVDFLSTAEKQLNVNKTEQLPTTNIKKTAHLTI